MKCASGAEWGTCSPDAAKRNPGGAVNPTLGSPALRFALCGLRRPNGRLWHS